MSFLRKKKSGVDFIQREKDIEDKIATEKKAAQKAKDAEKPTLQDGEVRVKEIETLSKAVVSDETSRERNRLKYKDTSGLVTSPEKNNYPTFTVFYLGRIPTNAEYGLEAVEPPVDQLCRLRDRQKLPKVTLTFDTEGLNVREIASSIFSKSKTKKDGIDLTLPLHYITYGVASEGHPQVFACITRMADDEVSADDSMPVLMLYGFLCDKADTAQQITYWQLQAYIEAYEELKRKKILRNRRKQALGTRNSKAGPQRGGKAIIPEEYVQPLPMYGNEPPPPMQELEEDQEGKDDHEEQLYAKPKKGHKVKNKGYVKPKRENGHIPSDDGGKAEDDDGDEDIREVPTPSPREMKRNDSVTSDDSGGGPRDVAFERRIGEMSELMVEMDAETLKKLMISNHPSLAREIYFTKESQRRATSHEEADNDEDV